MLSSHRLSAAGAGPLLGAYIPPRERYARSFDEARRNSSSYSLKYGVNKKRRHGVSSGGTTTSSNFVHGGHVQEALTASLHSRR
ncbi:hypothetical protein PFISCL1PPCAC_454, partial [Pristionchus fissidentatus]